MPVAAPVAIPVDDPMATLPLLLVHVPPKGVEFKVVVKPAQTVLIPVIVVGLAFTVTIVVTPGAQPVE